MARVFHVLGKLWMMMLSSNAPLTTATIFAVAAIAQRVSRSFEP